MTRLTRQGEKPCHTRNTSLAIHAVLCIQPSKSSHPGLPGQSVQPSLERYSKPGKPSHSSQSGPPGQPSQSGPHGQPSQSSFPSHASNTCIIFYQFYHFIG